MGSFTQVVFGFVWFIVGIILLIILWNNGWLTLMGNMMEDMIASIFYYVGLTIMILVLNFVIPIYLVIDGYTN